MAPVSLPRRVESHGLLLRFAVILAFSICAFPAFATTEHPCSAEPPQNQSPISDTENAHNNVLGKRFLRHLLDDQKMMWTSPKGGKIDDTLWLVPLAAVTASFIATDSAIMKNVSSSPTRLSFSHQASLVGTVSMVGVGGGAYLFGRFSGDEHARETGLLSAEAAINATGVTEFLKYSIGRRRPSENGGTGSFGAGGGSFPSEHSAVAWSIAAVIAHEYPGVATKLLAYGAATAIAAARVTGRDHFPSDVFVGSTLGFLIGRQVYGAHHNLDLPGSSYGTFVREKNPSPANMAAPYLPMDHWAYRAFDRFAALGYIPTAMLGIRPWTRFECARLVDELRGNIEGLMAGDLYKQYQELASEFAPELKRREDVRNFSVGVDSVYSRVMSISGRPLTDSYHFGETVYNDYGRPYGEGANFVTGVSTFASAGPLSVYVRGEFQHGAAFTPLSSAARQAIAFEDGTGIPAAGGQEINRLRLLDAYLSYTWHNFQSSFGNQTLWWGPSSNTAFLMSNNAEPIPMFRLDRVQPIELPTPLAWLGNVRFEFFVGMLNGHQFVTTTDSAGTIQRYTAPIRRHPYIHGEKITFKPTPNLEFGVSETTVFGGPGFPLTARSIVRSYGLSNALAGGPSDPGDRRSGFDFSYHLPKLRDRVILYNDSFAEDEISPIGYPRRSAMNPGVYLPKLPLLSKTDLRVEGIYTDLVDLRSGFFYYNTHYLSGYTNDGNIIGSWIGRAATGVTASSTSWLSSSTELQLGFRKVSVSQDFLEGGNVHDVSAGIIHRFKDVEFTGKLNYERWSFALLDSSARSNVTASFQLTYWPKQARKASR